MEQNAIGVKTFVDSFAWMTSRLLCGLDNGLRKPYEGKRPSWPERHEGKHDISERKMECVICSFTFDNTVVLDLYENISRNWTLNTF